MTAIAYDPDKGVWVEAKVIPDGFTLIDDGSLDTVFADDTGREYRYNFIGSGCESYDDFIDWCLEDLQDNIDEV